MTSSKVLQSASLALLFCLLAAVARSGEGNTQTGWLELEKGSLETTAGAQLVNIEEGDSADTQKITLAIPKNAIANPADIEEVVVVGQRPGKPEPLDITYEWVADYDGDNYGLVIYLGKNANWPIRLYLNSEPGFVE